MADKIFADGFRFDKPREGAPTFVKGRLSIKSPEAISFIKKYAQGGWVNLDLKLSQGGKLYLELNTFKKTESTLTEEQKEEIISARERAQKSSQEVEITEETPF